jgi:type I restriction enzyme S subunit
MTAERVKPAASIAPLPRTGEGPGVRALPRGWRWASLGDICKRISNGTSAPQGADHRQVPVTRIETISSGDINIGKVGWLATVEGIEKHRLNLGDILFSHINSLERLGNCAIYRGEPPLLVHGINLLRFQLNTEIIEPELCLRYLRTDAAKTFYLGTARRAIGQASINTSDIAALPIPLPPLPEQRRMASMLGDQLDAVHRAREAARARHEAARALTAAVLRSVFESEEAQQWPRASLGDLAAIVQNGLYKPAEFYGEGAPFIRMYNIRNDHWDLDLSSVAAVRVSAEESARYRLQVGDLLISRVNSFELLGKCGWVGASAEGFVFENMLIRVRLAPNADSRFMAHQLATGDVRDYIEQVAKRAIGQSSINSTDIKGLLVRSPPNATQVRIAEKVDDATKHSRSIAAGAVAELETIDALPQSLLRRAFAGEL